MLIAIDGEKAYRVTRDKIECFKFYMRSLIVFLILGFNVYKFAKFINVKWVIFCIIFELVMTIITPYTSGTIQKHFRPNTWNDN